MPFCKLIGEEKYLIIRFYPILTNELINKWVKN